ncbi:Uncharacterised protein [Burkholderia pseudomallei]|nr:Uncharacterised protein [Burkholderia pseudomallei]
MDITRFEQWVRDSHRTRQELENMKANALAKGEHDFARIAHDVLIERFSQNRRAGGSTPTTAAFRTSSKDFKTGKDAYIWLVGRFCDYRPDVLAQYERLRTQARAKGARFARNPDGLFPEKSSRRGDPSHYASVGSGWYADTNLNHSDKFAVLMQLAYVCGLQYTEDWDFRVTGATTDLVSHQKAVLWAKEALNELLDSSPHVTPHTPV